MNELLFSGTAQVALQGDRSLRFINSTHDRAVYEIIGFDHLHLTLTDYRQSGLQAIESLLASGNLSTFAPIFNTPAQVDIRQSEDGWLSIELSDPGKNIIEHVLWIAIGIGDSIPAYNYVLEYIASLDERHYAFVSLYRVLPFELSAIEINDSSSVPSPCA